MKYGLWFAAVALSACSTSATSLGRDSDAVGDAFNRAWSVSVGVCRKLRPATVEDLPPEVIHSGLNDDFFAVCNFEVVDWFKTDGVPNSFEILVANSRSKVPSDIAADFASVDDRQYFESNLGAAICIDPFGGVHRLDCRYFLPVVFFERDLVYFEGLSNIAFQLFPLDEDRKGYLARRLEELKNSPQ
jgi:hypothetical protein